MECQIFLIYIYLSFRNMFFGQKISKRKHEEKGKTYKKQMNLERKFSRLDKDEQDDYNAKTIEGMPKILSFETVKIAH